MYAQIAKALGALERRKVITTDPAEAEMCCGTPRDEDGFCLYRPHHPIYVDLTPRFGPLRGDVSD